MVDALADARNDYLAMLAGWIPFSRALCFLIFLLSLIAIDQGTPNGVFSTIASTTISKLFSSEDGLIWEASIFQLLLSLGMVLFLAYVHHAIKFSCFNLFAKIKNTSDYMQSLQDSKSQAANDPVALSTSKKPTRAESHLKRRSKELIRRNVVSEILLALAVTPIFLFYYSNILDAALAITCGVGSLLLQWNIFLYYIARYLPTVVATESSNTNMPYFGEGQIDEENDIWIRKKK